MNVSQGKVFFSCRDASLGFVCARGVSAAVCSKGILKFLAWQLQVRFLLELCQAKIHSAHVICPKRFK